jgi:glycosyltransferase involved in cell wall biosynthesis
MNRAIDMSISVCLATYNGEKHVVRQLFSILEQLAADDEVIIIDDCSTDDTVATVRRIADRRIAVYSNDRNRGEVHSFSRAIALATKEFVFLSDQDDVWISGRALMMTQALVDSGACLVTSNFESMDDNEKAVDIPYEGVASHNSTRHFRNIADIFLGKTNYFGCAMAFRRGFGALVTPIPQFVESHDLWIAMAGNLIGKNVHLDEKTLRKRKHANNVTSIVSNRSLYRKLRSRVVFAASVVLLLIRKRKNLTPNKAF